MNKKEKNKFLIDAAAEGNIQAVKEALADGADIHAGEDAALCWAAYYGRTETVALLLKKDANIHARDDEAVRTAAHYGHQEIVKLLLENGADVHAAENDALRLAKENGHREIIKTLKNWANKHSKSLQNHPKTTPTAPNATQKSTTTKKVDHNQLLHDAAEKGNIKGVKQALADGADFCANGDDALCAAAVNGHTAIVELLLDQGADIHALDDYPLILAADRGQTETVLLLLQKGANVHAKNGWALTLAFANDQTETVALLKNWAAGWRPPSPQDHPIPKPKAGNVKKKTLHSPKDTAEEQKQESNLAKQLEELKAAKVRARELGFTRPTNLGRTPGGRR